MPAVCGHPPLLRPRLRFGKLAVAQTRRRVDLDWHHSIGQLATSGQVVSRLGRIFWAMKKRPMPVEYSIFLLDGSERDTHLCIDAMAHLMDERTDDVRC